MTMLNVVDFLTARFCFQCFFSRPKNRKNSPLLATLPRLRGCLHWCSESETAAKRLGFMSFLSQAGLWDILRTRWRQLWLVCLKHKIKWNNKLGVLQIGHYAQFLVCHDWELIFSLRSWTAVLCLIVDSWSSLAGLVKHANWSAFYPWASFCPYTWLETLLTFPLYLSYPATY